MFHIRRQFSSTALFLLFCIQLLSYLNIHYVDAKVTVDRMKESSQFEFMEKFCFDEQDGKFSLFMEAGNEYAEETKFLFFADIETSWPTIYEMPIHSQQDCLFKEESAFLALKLSTINHEHTIIPVAGSRPRWWYLAVSNCERGIIDIPRYNVTMTNGPASEPFRYQFSKDEQGIYEMSIVFFCMHLLFVFLLLYTKNICKELGMQYRVVQLILLSALSSTVSLLCQLIHLAMYAGDGVGAKGIKDLSYFYDVVAELTQMILLLNIARGAYISTNHIDGQRITGLIFVTFMITYFFVHIYNIFWQDPAAVVFIYDSPPGYVLISIEIFTMCWFWYLVRTTLNKERDRLRQVFYVLFFLFGTAWFLAMPITTLVAISLPSWQRAKIVYGLKYTISTLLYVGFWWLFKPWGNQYVPILGLLEDRPFQSNVLIFPSEQPSIPKTATGILHSV